MHATAIGRRIENCVKLLQKGETENAAIHLFPAIDSTAKKRRDIGVGARIKAFITDEESLITVIAFRIQITGCSFGGKSISEAVYDYARCPLMHEGELDPRMTFEATDDIGLGGQWNLPPRFLFALAVAVILAPENAGIRIADDLGARILDQNYMINSIWGKRDDFRKMINGDTPQSDI